jgi:hypothetical protein
MPTEKMLSMLAAYMGDVTMTGVGRYVELSPTSYRRQLAQLRLGHTTLSPIASNELAIQ